MATRIIEVCYDPQTDTWSLKENGHDAHTVSHCKKGDKIRWEIANNCRSCSGLQIYFPNGNPFYPSKADPPANTDMSFADCHLPQYKYNLKLTCGVTDYEYDPVVQFDDGVGTGLSIDVLKTDRAALNLLASQGHEAFLALIRDVTAAADKERDPNGLFFPGGINNIQVQVTIPLGSTSMNVNVGISGPPASARFPEEESKIE